MKDAVTGSRSSQGRRTISTFTWIGLAIAAGLLWFARVQGDTTTVASEPVALLLAAYAGFSGIFAWMMFAPRRRSSEESPLLFVFGGITLLAPGIIAYCLMPPHSPLRGWLTVGIFLITVIAVMSPVPERFFAVPRDRASYLRPISDSLFSNLNYRDQLISFEHLGSSASSGSAEAVSASEWRREARDPWLDPFKGTGLEPTRPKVRKDTPPAGNPVGAGTSGTTLRDDQSSRSASGLRGGVSTPAAPVSRRVPLDIPLQTGRRPSGVFPPIPVRPTSVPLPPAAPAPVPRVSVPQTEHLPPNVSMPKSSPPKPLVSKPLVSQPPVSKPAVQPMARTESPSIGYRTPPIEARVPPAVPGLAAAKPPAISSAPAVPPLSVPASVRDSSAGAGKNSGGSRPATAAPIQRVPSAPAIIVTRPATGFGFRPTEMTTSRSSVPTAAASIAGTAAAVVSQVAETPSPSVSSFAATNGGARTGPAIHADNSDDTDNTDARPDSGIKFERIQDDFGGEMIEGTIRVLFEPGQKRAHLHVPFSPPLPGIPEVEVETVGDEQLRLKVGVRQSYGIRIEARRSEASERLETEIGFAAVCSRSGAR